MGVSHPGDDLTRLLAGRYRIVHAINSGSYGRVWAAVDEVLDREVAVKEVALPAHPTRLDRHAVREQAVREARAAGRVDHPGVIPVYDVVEHDGRPWIVMKLVRAPSLAELIERDGPLDPQRVARIGLQVLDALCAVHALGVIHRDVKPSNVLIEGDHVVLTDFGIAAIAGEATLTPADMVLGAPSFIAPECIGGEPATPAADLWALGATLYAAVEGRPPFCRETALAALAAAAISEPDPMRRAGPLAPLLVELLCRDRLRRPSAAAVERRLRHLTSPTAPPVTAVGAGAPVEPGSAPAVRRPRTRIGRPLAVSHAAAAAGLLVLGLWFGTRGEPQELDSSPPPPRSPAVDLPADDTPAAEPDPAVVPVMTRPSAAARPPVAAVPDHSTPVAPAQPVTAPATAPVTTPVTTPGASPPRQGGKPSDRPSTTPTAPTAGHPTPSTVPPPARGVPAPGS